MRLGGMHITMAYIASIGKLFGDGGLLSVLTESDQNQNQLIQGKHLKHGVRCIKLALEALFCLFWESMTSWLAKQGQTLISSEMEQHLRDIQHAFHAKN